MSTPSSEKPVDPTPPASSGSKTDSFGELLRKVALASVGAFVVAQEEIEELIRRLVEKGELAEKDGRALVRDLLDKRRRAEKDAVPPSAPTAAPPAPEIDGTIDRVLHKINVPTKGDVEELARKIDEIDRKIESLSGKRARG